MAIIDLIYHTPFNHNWQEILWYFHYKLKNLFKHSTFDMFYKVEIEINTNCNRRCSYCPNSLHPKKKRLMPLSTFKKIIQDLKKINYSGIIAPHSFNEPLLDRRLPALIKYTRNKLPNAYILIYTNGDNLTKQFYTRLLKAGVDKFFVTHHENRPPKAFLNWYKTDQNIIFQKMGPALTLSNRGGNAKVSNKKQFSRCSMPRNNLVINVDGDILLCCNDFFSRHKYGNVKNNSLIKIWNSRRYRQARRDISKGDFKLNICKKCCD